MSHEHEHHCSPLFILVQAENHPTYTRMTMDDLVNFTDTARWSAWRPVWHRSPAPRCWFQPMRAGGTAQICWTRWVEVPRWVQGIQHRNGGNHRKPQSQAPVLMSFDFIFVEIFLLFFFSRSLGHVHVKKVECWQPLHLAMSNLGQNGPTHWWHAPGLETSLFSFQLLEPHLPPCPRTNHPENPPAKQTFSPQFFRRSSGQFCALLLSNGRGKKNFGQAIFLVAPLWPTGSPLHQHPMLGTAPWSDPKTWTQ